jgi:DNA-binding LacI/PurR family transcriptional regulator
MSVRQIAKLAGISPAAVSLALRRSPKVSAATQRLVGRLAQRLNYRPNAKIRELMTHLRATRGTGSEACFGVMSLYPSPRPWEQSLHLTRIFDGMTERAMALGYRLEPLWLRAPNMRLRRFRSILDARGVQGLLCFGGPNLEEEFPAQLDHYAIVNQGLSLNTPLHRVISHAYNDTIHTLDRLARLGYRRPGLVLGRYEEIRCAHAHLSAFLGWCDHHLGPADPIPVLRLERVEQQPFAQWLERHRPDVIVYVHLYDTLREFTNRLRAHGLRIPEQIGVAVLSQVIEGTGFSGMQENQTVIGARTVELLVDRIMDRDFGIPTDPRIEMVEGRWIEGSSLRSAPPARSPRRLALT